MNLNYDQVREMQYVQGNIASLLKQLNVMSAGMGAPGMDLSAYGAMPGMMPADLAAAAGVHPSGMPAYMPPPPPQQQQQHYRGPAPMTPPPYAAMPGMPALSPSLPNSQFLQQQQQQQQQRTPPQQQQQARGLPRRSAHTPLAAARSAKAHSARAALAELPLNSGADASDEQPQRSPLKALIERERMQRLAAERLEVTESARLEMNIQNLNIRKHSQKAAEAASSGTALSPGYPRTPQRGEHEHGGAACPKTCEREENADGTIKYDFSTGLPGGTCVYFMKGFCAIGNRCRYVHDETDEGAIVKVTGMPYTITVQNVIDFFAPLALTEENISFIMSKEGKQTGSAFVEFRNRKDALLALGKDRTFINEARFVLIYPSSKNERGWFVANPMPFSQHATPSVQRGGNSNGNSNSHHNGSSNVNGGSTDRSHKAASSPRVRTPAAAPVSASAAAAAAASAAALPVTPLSPHQMLQMQQALSPAAAVFNPALAAMQQQQVAAAQHTAQKQLQRMVAGSEELKTPTPVKQLSFDESEDKKDDTPSKRQEQLLSELARKLCSPNALRNLPEDQLTALLASVGFSEEKKAQITADVKEVRVKATARQGLPPLVPLHPSKAA